MRWLLGNPLPAKQQRFFSVEKKNKLYYNENRKSGENVERKLKTRHLYRHFKGKLYYVMNIGLDSETLEEVVIYQAMYDDKKHLFVL